VHDELQELVTAGLTPAEALKAATWNGAEFLGRTAEFGSIEKGKLADLVLLEANPLTDVRNTRKIAAVVLNGQYLDRSALDRLLSTAEAAATR
jgi:imidazolonepropionase-like amidohydrolase